MANVERYLEQADFYRAVAKGAPDFGTRLCLEHLARSYEVLARSEKRLEQAARAQQALRQPYRPLSPPPARGGVKQCSVVA
jgi:hypothetical protein